MSCLLKKGILGLLFTAMVFLSGCVDKKPKKLTIATAANMQFTMLALMEAFTAQSGIKCQSIVGPSGNLTAQITHGAPFDVFVAANMQYPQEVYDKGFALQAPQIFAYGSLILWTAVDTVTPSLKMITEPQIKHIALANPKTAPYGTAAVEVLKNADLYEQVKDKLVFGQSIAQTDQFIISGAATLGFTAKSVVLSKEMKNKGKWVEIDHGLYKKISQGVVVIKHKDKNNAEAQQFYDFLFTPRAKKIVEDFGYYTD